MKITIIRHGKPAFELKGSVRGKDLGMIAQSYDNSGIVDEPPCETISAISGPSFIICSHLRRSIESAGALGCQEVHLSDSIFCEAAIPHVERGNIPLPITLWIIVLRLMWLFGYSKNGESFANTRKRARQAAARLIELAEKHQDILLVGHGVMNHFIAKELRRIGWSGPRSPGKKYWEFAHYVCGAS